MRYRLTYIMIVSLFLLQGCKDDSIIMSDDLDCDTGTVTVNELFGCKLSNDFWQYGYNSIENLETYDLVYFNPNSDERVLDFIIKAHSRNHIDSLEFLIITEYRGVTYDSYDSNKPNIIFSSATFQETGSNAICDFRLEFITNSTDTCAIEGNFNLSE